MSAHTFISGRLFQHFDRTGWPDFKVQMLNWCAQFNICCFMDNHEYAGKLHSFECLLAVGEHARISLPAGNALAELRQFRTNQKDWLIGHLGFGLKSETVQSKNGLPGKFGFADLDFFVPEHLIIVDDTGIWISSHIADPAAIYQAIASSTPLAKATETAHFRHWQTGLNKTSYVEKIEALKAHIHRGDCYEINFCQEFSAAGCVIDPIKTFRNLTRVSPTPFSVFYRLHDEYLLCASPERFFKLDGTQVWSQPMKGTAPRNRQDAVLDKENANALINSQKERSENVMVVDLVRNDLSRVCRSGTVEVKELFGIYSFPQVHQLVSTVTGELDEGKTVEDVIAALFPMGSMTGAPKQKVLQLIEQYEQVHRGLFSGAVGYIHPSGDADFNVVIRSILYNAHSRDLSYLVGSGITWYSNPEEEFDECNWKAAAIREVLDLNPPVGSI